MNGMPDHNYNSPIAASAGRVIYPSSRVSRYATLLICVKVLLGLSYFLSYDVLKHVHVVQFLFIAKAIASVALIVIQKPFSSGKQLSRTQCFRLLRHSTIQSGITLLWLYGLTHCGPLRTTLLLQHSDFVVVSVASALFTGSGGHSKFRGSACFLVAICSLLFLDHDSANATPTEHPEGHYHGGISHVFYYSISWLGLADHKAGVLLLMFVLCLQTGFNVATRRLAVEIGGAKRLNAVTTLTTTALLAPWAFFLRLTQNFTGTSWSSLIGPLLIIALTFFVIDYYAETICTTHLEPPQCARLGSICVFGVALVLSWVWSGSLLRDWTLRENNYKEEHALSGGVLFSWLMFAFATVILTSPPSRSSTGTFVGYSSSGLPLYTFSGDVLQRTSQSFLLVVRRGLQQILEESDSRKIFYFLCLNLCFTFVELIYGIWTNSLGLISDGFHMMFDCSALVMGLCASLLARKKATRTYPHGYGRVEVISGFVNGLFLVIVAFMVFTEAINRIFDPPEILTEKLLTVSMAGLCVNLVGIFVFSHSHTHSHSHEPSSHGHTHSHSHHHADNTNIRGVFLHILADTLGSVGVIASSLLIENFELFIADPLCSLFIAVLIFLSVLPLLKQTSVILLLRSPLGMDKDLSAGLTKVSNLDGVLSYREQHFWQHSANNLMGTIHIQASPGSSEQKIISQVTAIFKELGFGKFTVQVEKEEYYHHIAGLCSVHQNMMLRAPGRVLRGANGDQASTVIKSV